MTTASTVIKHLPLKRIIAAVAISGAVVLAAGSATAYASFQFDSKTIGIGTVQNSESTPATAEDSATRLQLPTQSITSDSISALATPTEQTAVQEVAAPEAAPAATDEGTQATEATPASGASDAAAPASTSDAPAATTAAPAATTTPTTSADAAATEASIPWETGVASWYNDSKLRNRSYYGVAHRTLPFGTQIEVEYNGNKIIATVDDRGPFVQGRVLDLNENCANALGFKSAGVATVNYRVI